MVLFYSQGQPQWISPLEAEGNGLVPVNINGQTVYMHPEEANANGLGLFGSKKKRKKAERKAAEAAAAAQAAAAKLTNTSAVIQNNIPAYQAELAQYKQLVNQEVSRVGASVPTTMAYVGAGAGLLAFGYTAFQAFKNRKRKSK